MVDKSRSCLTLVVTASLGLDLHNLAPLAKLSPWMLNSRNEFIIGESWNCFRQLKPNRRSLFIIIWNITLNFPFTLADLSFFFGDPSTMKLGSSLISVSDGVWELSASSNFTHPKSGLCCDRETDWRMGGVIVVFVGIK